MIWTKSFIANSIKRILLLSVISFSIFSIVTTTAIAQPFTYVVNELSSNVSVIDVPTNTVVATVSVGTFPIGIAMTPDGAFAYVANQGSNDVSVIEIASNTVVATVGAVGAYNIAITPDGAFAYVTDASSTMSVIDIPTNTVITTVVVGTIPIGVAITPDGAFAYVPNSGSGNVSVVATATNTVIATVNVGSGPRGISITPNGTFAYVTNQGSSDVSVIDIATNTVVATVDVGIGPLGVAMTPDGAFAYVINQGPDNVSVIDMATNTIVATVGVGTDPIGVAITPDGAFAYVTNFWSGTVSVVATATNTVIATVGVGTRPRGIAIMPELFPTNISGNISTNTTWTPSGSPYIITGNTFVDSSVTLTIEPGVEVRFQSDMSLQVDGDLVAMGTADNMVIFTSDSGTVAGSWGFIKFTDGSIDATFDTDGNYTGGSILEYCQISFGGGTGSGMIYIDQSAPLINNCKVMNSAVNGIYISQGGTQITNSTVSNNGEGGIRINNYPYGVGPTVTVSNSTITDNSVDGIYAYFYSAANAGIFTNNTIKANGGSGIRASSGPLTITDNFIVFNDDRGVNMDGGGCTTAQISNNFIIGNSGGGINENPGWCGTTSTISNNVIAENQASNGGALYVSGGGSNTVYVRDNIITNNHASGNAVIYWSGSAADEFVRNTVTGNTDNSSNHVTLYASGTSSINNNHFYNPNNTYELHNGNASGPTHLNAMNNWWGTTDESLIQAIIYDWFDDVSLGMVDYDPYLTSPDIDAPISPPTNVVKSASGSDVQLSWSANPEGDLAGYKVYWGSPTGYSFANVVDVGNVTSYTLSGVSLLDTIAVTAYDNQADGADDQIEGLESWFAIAETSVLGFVDDYSGIPEVFALHQNYPNPFNPVTTLRYDLPEQLFVTITIYDILGREVRYLVNRIEEPGYKSVIWNATNDHGKPVSAGVYFYQILADDFVQVKKMILL